MLWQLRQSGIAELHLPPFGRIDARASEPLAEEPEEEEGEEGGGGATEGEGAGTP